MNKYQKDVAQFHEAMGQADPDTPTMPDEATRELRCDLIEEELYELRDAFGLHGDVPDPVKVADALADLLYVVYGTANVMGLDMDPIWDEVHRSNMTKFIDGHKREDGKWIKGPSYSPANLEPIIEAHKQKEGE